jgi:hypothetical protein
MSRGIYDSWLDASTSQVLETREIAYSYAIEPDESEHIYKERMKKSLNDEPEVRKAVIQAARYLDGDKTIPVVIACMDIEFKNVRNENKDNIFCNFGNCSAFKNLLIKKFRQLVERGIELSKYRIYAKNLLEDRELGSYFSSRGGYNDYYEDIDNCNEDDN